MNIQNKTKNDPKSGLQELHQVNNSSLVKSQNRIHTYTVLAYTSGIITTLIGLIVLIGWKMDLTLLKTFGISAVTMKPNAAICFILAGFALLLLQSNHSVAKVVVRLFSVLVLILASLTFSEYLFSYNIPIDDIFHKVIHDQSGYLPDPGRMAANSALNFIFVGIVLLYLSFRKKQVNFLIEFCLTAAFSISVF